MAANLLRICMRLLHTGVVQIIRTFPIFCGNGHVCCIKRTPVKTTQCAIGVIAIISRAPAREHTHTAPHGRERET